MKRRLFLKEVSAAIGVAVGFEAVGRDVKSAEMDSLSGGSAWMQKNLGRIGKRNLRNLCIPGSHDAGMSLFKPGTLFARPCNTCTQKLSIYQQLEAGVRYFDIRPVISGGEFMTGHYSKFGIINSWQGANGQSIQSVIDDVNKFSSENNELIILHLSHDLDTDVGNSSYSDFTPYQWNDLLVQLLEGLQRLYFTPDEDLTKIPLNSFIGNGRAAVVVVVEPSSESAVPLSQYRQQGFYPVTAFPIYNKYSNTKILDSMIADQLEKLKEQRSGADSPCFLLSWTLTQDTLGALTCGSFFSQTPSIIQLASEANAVLETRLMPACTPECFPNILFVDAVDGSLGLPSLAMRINSLSK